MLNNQSPTARFIGKTMNDLLPWQHSQWERVMQSKSAGRLPHALLCSGPRGLGKRRFAEGLAQSLLCSNPALDGSPCNTCRSCRLSRAGNHPDYSLVEPLEAGKPILVDQIRELCAFLGYTSQGGGWKIALLAPAERMNVSAANSLLKTLEEPPAGSLLLLVTAAPARLPATVRSRCQTLIFQTPAPEQAVAWLTAHTGSAAAEAGLLLSLSHGAPLTARDYAKGDYLARRQVLFNSYWAVVTGKADPVSTAEGWVKDDAAEQLRWLIGWHMDMIRLKMTAQPPQLLNPDWQDALRRLAAGLPAQTLFRRLDAAIRLHSLCVTQVNLQLMIEEFLGDCAGG